MPDHIPNPQPSHDLYICDIEIQTQKSFDRVYVLLDGVRAATLERPELKCDFDPLRKMPSKNITFQIDNGFFAKIFTTTKTKINTREWSSQFISDTEGRQERRLSQDGIEAIIGVVCQASQPMAEEMLPHRPLQSTTEEILKICPKFRILVIGKSGAGKSSLINKTFGVMDAQVSDGAPGKADINKEIPSKNNPHFLLHDSQGFEHGEDEHIKTVQKFVNDRTKEHHIKDKLHAIWLCIEIPIHGSRLLESGVEEFLKLKAEGKLKEVPVIAVFTKYDLLTDAEALNLTRPGLTEEAILKQARQNAAETFKKKIKPFGTLIDSQLVPHIAVSTQPEYKLPELIEVTYERVYKYLEEASVVSAIAQIVSPSVKIDASIGVGKKKYWKSLASSTNFPGMKLQDCLNVIHIDIVKVWGFEDPNRYLHSKEFYSLLSNVADMSEGPTSVPDPNQIGAAGLSMVSSLYGIVSTLSGAAPIVIPIVAGLVLAAWIRGVYERSKPVTKHLMAYIIDLTLIMQNIFWLKVTKANDAPLSRRLIKLAVSAYKKSNARSFTHVGIHGYVDGDHGNHIGRDHTLEKIISLIKEYRIESTEMFELENMIGSVDLTKDDEDWDSGSRESNTEAY